MDWFDITDWLFFGPASEELAEEQRQDELDQEFDNDEYDVDQNEDYS